MDPIAEFERIEALAKSGAFRTMPISRARNERDTLLRSTPTSNNPQFIQRWDRVLMQLNERIEELAWWQKPTGAIAIAVLSTVLSAALTFWLGLT